MSEYKLRARIDRMAQRLLEIYGGDTSWPQGCENSCFLLPLVDEPVSMAAYEAAADRYIALILSQDYDVKIDDGEYPRIAGYFRSYAQWLDDYVRVPLMDAAEMMRFFRRLVLTRKRRDRKNNFWAARKYRAHKKAHPCQCKICVREAEEYERHIDPRWLL